MTAAALTLLLLAAAPPLPDQDLAQAIDDARALNAAARQANAEARALNGPARRAAEAKAAGMAAAPGMHAVAVTASAAPPALAPAVATSRTPAPAVSQAAAPAPAAPAPASAPAGKAQQASAPAPAPARAAANAACKGTIYLTFDTGSQSQARLIAETLNRHKIKATFFLANEKTAGGGMSLDSSWATYWKLRVAEGHAFGSHTFDHVVLVKDGAGGKIDVKPGFGEQAGKQLSWTPEQYCKEIKRVDQRFAQLTGHHLDPIWRAPAGRTSPRTLAAAQACGYTHFGWPPAGFSGDELPSGTYPNEVLLQKSLRELRDGDIFVAHMGIWSRKDAWAPANLEPLISGLEQKGFCFATLRDHPDFRPASKHK